MSSNDDEDQNRKMEEKDQDENAAQEKAFPTLRNAQGMPIPFVFPEPPKKPSTSDKDNQDPNWLPNFGRVWQSGTRRDTQKEFSKEQRQRRQHNEAVKSANELLSRNELEASHLQESSASNSLSQHGAAMTFIYHNPVYVYPQENSEETKSRETDAASAQQAQSQELSKINELLKRKEALKAKLLKSRKLS